MGRYIAGRLLKAVLLLLVISAVVFVYIHLSSDNHAGAMAGLEVTPEEEAAICEEFRLEKPGIVERFKSSIKSMFSLEVGCTPKFRVPAQGTNMESTQ